MMKLTKEIEDLKKSEERLTRSLKDRSDECCRLNHENNLLKLELMQSKNNEQELERKIIILRDELTTANEYKEKFNASSTKLDEILQIQKNRGDMGGLGFEKGEIYRSGQSNQQKNKGPLVRQPNAYKFNNKFFVCKKFGHMESQRKNREN